MGQSNWIISPRLSPFDHAIFGKPIWNCHCVYLRNQFEVKSIRFLFESTFTNRVVDKNRNLFYLLNILPERIIMDQY